MAILFTHNSCREKYIPKKRTLWYFPMILRLYSASLLLSSFSLNSCSHASSSRSLSTRLLADILWSPTLSTCARSRFKSRIRLFSAWVLVLLSMSFDTCGRFFGFW